MLVGQSGIRVVDQSPWERVTETMSSTLTALLSMSRVVSSHRPLRKRVLSTLSLVTTKSEPSRRFRVMPTLPPGMYFSPLVWTHRVFTSTSPPPKVLLGRTLSSGKVRISLLG